jgi:hypothetical protein
VRAYLPAQWESSVNLARGGRQSNISPERRSLGRIDGSVTTVDLARQTSLIQSYQNHRLIQDVNKKKTVIFQKASKTFDIFPPEVRARPLGTDETSLKPSSLVRDLREIFG